jgi:hypothetical protein
VIEKIAHFFEVTHAYRAIGWVILVPIVIAVDLHQSVFIVFLYSTYANVAGDIAAWQAKRAEEKIVAQ